MPTQQQIIAALGNPALTSLSDADAATALNVPTYKDVAVPALAALVDTLGIRPHLVAAQENANPQVAGSAVTAVGVIAAPYPFVQL